MLNFLHLTHNRNHKLAKPEKTLRK